MRLRIALIVLLNSLAMLGVLLCAIEILLRVGFGGAIPIQSFPPGVVGLVRSASEIRLAADPLLVTDANGFWVANRNRPGINADGFRSPPFDEPAGGRKTLMMIGDSFTWGEAAKPINMAFPDEVRRAGYKVCNLGISGLSTVQYRAEAEVFVPKIRPDAVCVMFYLGNDFDEEPPIRPGFPRNYETNVAELRALRQDGAPIPFADAAQEFAGWYGAGPLRDLRRRMVGTATWTVMRQFVAKSRTREELAVAAIENLAAIKRVSEQHGAQFLLFLLPSRPEYAGAMSDPAEAREILRDFAPVGPPEMATALFAPMPEAHFNNAGHAQYAAFVVEILKQRGLAPRTAAAPQGAP